MRLLQRYGRVAGTLALVGMAFYALLLPWHIVSQATTAMVDAELGRSLAIICHADPASGAHDRNGSPARPRTSCPICQGLAALHLAVLPTALEFSPPVLSTTMSFAVVGHDRPALQALAPQNRGPPALRL